MMIKIDDRESKEFQDIYDIFFDDYKIDHLLVGDIVVNDQVCFEHKTSSDFIASIFDNRLFKQIEQMKSNYNHNYIIISGSLTDIISTPNTKYESLMGAITSCFVRQCPVIFCDDYYNACDMIKKLSTKLLDGKNRTIPVVKIPIENDQLRLVCSIPGISEKRGHLLLDRFESPMNVFNGSHDDITEIKGIKDKTFNKMTEILYGKV